MATSYKTPGVFLEEIPKLPPSVAQVETAIPAFVGYTEIAQDLAPDDLKNVPTRIGSLVEYELYFGGGPSPAVTEVDIDSSNKFVSAKVTNSYFLYDSVRMFYANGGGDCFIVSVGRYPATVAATDLTGGLTALEKADDPTILLFPDAVVLNDNDIATVQQAALLQCNNLQDRVAVFDVRQNDPKGTTFRNNVGINYLKYGMCYTPWLKVTLPKAVKYTDVKSVVYRSGILTTLSGLTTDADVQALITKIDQAYVDVAYINTRTAAVASPGADFMAKWNSLQATFNASGNNTNANMKALFDFTYDIAHEIDGYVNGAAPNTLTLPALKADVTAAVASNFDPVLAQIVALNKEAGADITAAYTPTDVTTRVTAASWPLSAAAAASNNINESNDNNRRIAAVNLLKPLFVQLNIAYLNLVVGSAANYTTTLEDSLTLSFPVYKAIITGVANSMTSMPPSGAVVGVYAATDRTRGVWKAPANVALANVVGPDTTFTASELDALNVDAVSGKSINAIRAFTGKGTLVFGARTLAGNDNEWRYISVRRFFNMVEESCKNATEPFVFEPNDANTWVRIQGMIENFLTTLWRQGALQGAKPEQAFYVAVGLGKTMTALDILEGRMIVEIGMAVVRPAEFIILRFSHKMAES